MFIGNKGNSTNFMIAGKEVVLDRAPLILNRRVLEDHFFSHHRYVGFSLDESHIGIPGTQPGACITGIFDLRFRALQGRTHCSLPTRWKSASKSSALHTTLSRKIKSI